MAALHRVISNHVISNRAISNRASFLSGAVLSVVVSLPSCALPPAMTPEDPPLVEADDKPPLSSGGLTAEQNRQLLAGGRVEELMEMNRQGQRYVGGVSYMLVRAEPRQVFDVLNQLTTLSQVLPSTRSTRIIDARAAGGPQ
jgi:hypothetical protein